MRDDASWRTTALEVLDELEAGGIPAPQPRVRAYRIVPARRSRCAECERLRILIGRAQRQPSRTAAVLEQALVAVLDPIRSKA